MFGPIMEFEVGELKIRLAPLSKEVMPQFIENGGMQSHKVTRYLGRQASPLLEDEHEWYEESRTNKATISWGIFVWKDDAWLLLGDTSLHNLDNTGFATAVSGCVIFRPVYWGMGIAKHAHRARTMYAFDQLHLTLVRSAVMSPNEGSFRALQGVGYVHVGTMRNESFRDGQWLHRRNLEMLNPSMETWRTWWHGDAAPLAFREARKKTQAALDWAHEHVRFV